MAQHRYVRPSALGLMHNSLGRAWMPLEILPKRAKYRETRRHKLFGLYLPLAEPRRPRSAHVIDDSIYCRKSRIADYDPAAILPPEPPGGPSCTYD
jgi:hypothetical protein